MKIALFFAFCILITGCSSTERNGCNKIYLTKTVKTDCTGSKKEGTWSCETYECPSLF